METQMIDGTYKIEVNLLLGKKEGKIVLRTEGDAVFADIDAPLVGEAKVEGTAEGDTFTAEGSGKIKLVGKVDYTIKGKVKGDILHLNIHSTKGDFSLEGVRV